VDEIHKKSTYYVQAKTQAAILKYLMDELDEAETEVV
jgi:ribonuclease-3 family protein